MNYTPRQMAVKEGNTRYFTGKPCPRGHIAERMVSTRGCCECVSEKKKAWVAENPEKERAQKRAYKAANPEKVRQWNLDNQKLHRDSANIRQRRWYAANHEQANAATSDWAKANPDKNCAKTARRRAAQLEQMPSWADQDAIDDVYQAAAVVRSFGHDVHVDHIIPLQGKEARGLHVHYNLQIIDSKVNREKSNRI